MKQKTLAEISQIEIPILRIDELIENSKNLAERTEKIIKLFIQSIKEHLSLSESDNLFDSSLTYQFKQFISICLLRLLNKNRNIFKPGEEFYRDAIDFFDETLHEIYKERNIDKKKQRFEKSQLLEDYVIEIENNVDTNIIKKPDLNHFTVFEQNYRKALSGKKNKFILIHFLPEGISSEIDKLFHSIRDYLSDESSKKAERYKVTIEIFENIEVITSELKTYYCITYIIEPIGELKKLIVSDFGNSSYGKPADLQIKAYDKKYQLILLY